MLVVHVQTGFAIISPHRYTLRPHHSKHHLACNVDERMVRRLQERGFVLAANLCLCLYIHRMANLIRRLGGIVAAHLDVWGTFAHGASIPLNLLARLHLFNADAIHGALVLFAASVQASRSLKSTKKAKRENEHGNEKRYHARTGFI